MFLHLWCLGLRASEVCTLKGNAYYQQGCLLYTSAMGGLGTAMVSGAVIGAIGGASYSAVNSGLSGNSLKQVAKDTLVAVSYTHLDVYKRQSLIRMKM